ncbi:MAG: hypothetical protein ACRDNL_02265, partial [Spirillospora sp.]
MGVNGDVTRAPVDTVPSVPETIRILLAEDVALLRGALTGLLDLEPDLEVVAEIGSGDAIVKAALRHRPDVAVLDVD